MISAPDLATIFHRLTAVQKQSVHLSLCEQALSVWRKYVANQPITTYIDSVTGASHVVENGLPEDAFQSVLSGRDIAHVAKRYREPIVAMQDDDLRFPEKIEFAYYALHNLFKKYVMNEKVDDWIVVNQALAAQDLSKINELLANAIAAEKKHGNRDTTP